MNPGDYCKNAQSVEAASGRISYVERGSGPAALFVHGVLLNGWFWRNQLHEFQDRRRCIAIDLLAHGRTQIKPEQDVSVTANAHMIQQFLDALKIDQVDLVGNDSGGGVCQIFAANHPDRVRSLTLTNCDAQDNWPPEAFKGVVELARKGGLPGLLAKMAGDKSIYRSEVDFAADQPELPELNSGTTQLHPQLPIVTLAAPDIPTFPAVSVATAVIVAVPLVNFVVSHSTV